MEEFWLVLALLILCAIWLIVKVFEKRVDEMIKRKVFSTLQKRLASQGGLDADEFETLKDIAVELGIVEKDGE